MAIVRMRVLRLDAREERRRLKPILSASSQTISSAYVGSLPTQGTAP
jgi:hypothetical protein